MLYRVLRAVYLAIKKVPGLGPVIVRVREAFFSSNIYRRVLRRRDIAQARTYLRQLYHSPTDMMRIDKYLRSAVRSSVFGTNYAHGYSGDFDVLILYCLIRLLQPEIVVETGVASGRSSSFMLLAMSHNQKGTLYSIDLPQFYTGDAPMQYLTTEGNSELTGFIPQGKKPGWLVPSELRTRWHYIEGDSQKQLPELLTRLSHIDVFYHDSDHSYDNMKFEFNTVWDKIASGGFLLSDDVSWNTAFAEFVQEQHLQQVYQYRNFGIIKK